MVKLLPFRNTDCLSSEVLLQTPASKCAWEFQEKKKTSTDKSHKMTYVDVTLMISANVIY